MTKVFCDICDTELVTHPPTWVELPDAKRHKLIVHMSKLSKGDRELDVCRSCFMVVMREFAAQAQERS